jgi:hypothetical protein
MGTLEDVLKKSLQMQEYPSTGAPVRLRETWNLERGSYTGDFERRMK